MADNSMAISFSSDSDLVSFNHPSPSPPPADTNQAQENLLLPTQQPKKPRGRPPGSKNKRKARSSDEPYVKVVIINVEPGKDVMESIIDVASQSQTNLTVLSASGTIARVSLHNPPNATAATTLHGPLALLSLNGSYLYNNNNNLNLHPPPLSFTIQLTNTEGQVFGGAIAGEVIAGDALSLTLSTFSDPAIHNYNSKGDNDHHNNINMSSDSIRAGNNPLGFNMVNCGTRGW